MLENVENLKYCQKWRRKYVQDYKIVTCVNFNQANNILWSYGVTYGTMMEVGQ